MTKIEALHILIEHAAKNCVGAGCGSGHQVPSYEERNRVALAIKKVWPEKHYEPSWHNLRLSEPDAGNLPPCDVPGRACEGCEFKPCPME